MSSKRKRAKKSVAVNPIINNDTQSGNQAPVGTSIVESLPLEVLQHILEVTSAVETLKPWRLVSRSWNEVGCRILRKVAEVLCYAAEDDEEDLEAFKDLIIDRLAYFPPDWPNPFQNYKILGTSLLTANLIRFLERPDFKITTFEIVHGNKDFDPLSFESLLEKLKGELVHLKIRGSNTDTAPFLTLGDKLGAGGWRSLKFLTLTDTCKAPLSSKPCPHVQFIIALKANLALEGITLNGVLDNITRTFEGKDQCWDKLLRLKLEWDEPPPNLTQAQIHELMSWTEEINFHPLTHLSMWFNDNEKAAVSAEQYTRYILPLVERSWEVVKSLRVNFIPLSLIPSLPKLEFLNCAMIDDDRVEDITELKFPALTSIYPELFWTKVPAYVIPKEEEKNKKIVSVTVFWGDQVPAEVTQELFWPILRDQFPNLRELIHTRTVTSVMLQAIRKRLPQLQDMTLAYASPLVVLGTVSGPAFTAQGWPCEAYFENSALLEMHELTHLRLGEGVGVSRDVISACLGKLPKVKFLSFYWNNLLQTTDVSEHLRHIQHVQIVYKDKEQKRTIQKLTRTIKNIRLVKHE